jgi:hypothetical protein
MKTEKNRSWMVWAIILLAVMNISTVATILYHQYRTGKSFAGEPQVQQQNVTDAEKFSGRYFRDKLNLDGNQMDRFREINPIFRQQARIINIELASARKQMLDEMSSADPDTNRLNALSDSIGHLHSNLKKITFRYYLDLNFICNEEQKGQLEQLFSEMFTNDSSLGFPGKGGRGRQFGKRINNN